MTVCDLNKAIGNIDGKYLDIADAAERRQRKCQTGKKSSQLFLQRV